MKLNFLHGTETGTTEFLCEDMETAVADRCTATVASMDDADPHALDADTVHVLVSATFGSGDVPGTAIGFYDTLQKDKPDLSHVRFAVFGLGDTTFRETYNQGSEKLMTAMLACGAKMIGERGLYDSSSADMPEDVGVPWIEGILETLSTEA